MSTTRNQRARSTRVPIPVREAAREVVDYSRLTLADRKAIVEILRDTRKDLPAYFGFITR
jgi:hypothetical protein